MKIRKIFQELTSKEKGAKAEDFAANYLCSKGYKILERNFKAPFGEIDIIAQKKETLIFVEVKSEFSNEELLAEEKVNLRKREKIFKVAEYFLLKNSEKLSKIKEIRFDVMVVKGKSGEVIHYESAFFKERNLSRD